MPGLAFRDVAIHRHRDTMQREYRGLKEDRYLSPYNGYLVKLVVQAGQEVYDGAPNSTWRWTFVRDISPYFIRIANYPLNGMPVDKETWTGEDWAIVTVKWFFACVELLPTVSFFVMLSYVTCRHQSC